MELKIKYFGMLTEITACNEEVFQFKGSTVADLTQALLNQYPTLKTKTFRVAQNNTLITDEIIISSPNIMLLPPFAGG
jgi:molybdopterin synthase sulfur carrier subunit